MIQDHLNEINYHYFIIICIPVSKWIPIMFETHWLSQAFGKTWSLTVNSNSKSNKRGMMLYYIKINDKAWRKRENPQDIGFSLRKWNAATYWWKSCFFCEHGQRVFFERQSTVYASHSASQPPPLGGSTSGRDSLESKVTFIQLSEWVSLLECTTDKDFTALKTARELHRFTLKPYRHKVIYSTL